ncbi:SDR family oxidoreductase [Blastopirellula marina]|uniref:Oxidoreductase n=1 Tax=Blastopirellula marina TaxID=124 RepID=A0A2S8F7K4_9BACT|nr:SDR family NAD(P)-dependent oxidoreductase [Blastopirellula marina]PQO28142.1 oxidoreductase [Blastopirellula marina]PTL41682.1 KR domain-containing protein [Blastopirellula marina]
MQMSGNTILITGGTSGIGRSLAEAFHDLGTQVIITGRREALLAEVTAARPGMVGIPLDVNNRSSISSLREKVISTHPQINVLIANAGISRSEDVTADPWNLSAAEEMIQTNILGTLRVAAAFLPLLKRSLNPVFMATTSNLAFIPQADYPTYCATKAFLHSWLQSLRHQLRTTPVQVLELSPPYVQTELTGKDQASDPRAMPLDDYVAEVMQLLSTENHPNGEVLAERGSERRWAEREGRYDAVFAAMNSISRH